MSSDVLLFAIPKAFEGHIGLIQRNAINSWALLQPRPEIILFGDDLGTKECAAELGAQHISEVARSSRGTPLLSDLFMQAQDLAGSRVLAYVNADIILISSFMRGIEEVARRKSRFMISGERWDVDITKPWDFSNGWEQRLRKFVLEHGKPRGPGAMDYFVFTSRLLGEIPPFAVGRSGWDNWLLARTRKRLAPLVDASRSVMVVHQNHDYGSLGIEGAFKGDEALVNQELMGERAFTLHAATHVLIDDRLHSTFTLGHIPYRLWDITYHYRALRFLRPILRTGKNLIKSVKSSSSR